MELLEFLIKTQQDIGEEIGTRFAASVDTYPYQESVFTEVVMAHMQDIGMTFEPQVCHYASKFGNAIFRISGYALSEDLDQLDLFVGLYKGSETLVNIPESEVKNAAEQCFRFVQLCAQDKIISKINEANDIYELAFMIKKKFKDFEQIRVFVITDMVAKNKIFKPRTILDKTIQLEVMDIERLYRHWSEGKPRDELVVDFSSLNGSPLPCIYMPGELEEYDYALTAIPGEALRFLYERYGQRLLESNVRSFLSSTGKVNKGISNTLQVEPKRFMAYNNGIVMTVDEISIDKGHDGVPGIQWAKGIQIVNGGQTTASIYFTKKKYKNIDLANVRVPAKIIILKENGLADEESLIANISKYANSQNAVRASDLSSNKPFHIEIEKLSMTTFCPDGVGRWFYERANGGYKTMLMMEGSTPVKLKHLKTKIVPASRKITKTDLAKFINIWDGKPEIVSLGAQKNFVAFMKDISGVDDDSPDFFPDLEYYKKMIAKAILFKKATSIVRPLFNAFRANIVVYMIAMMAYRYGEDFDLMRIWSQQGISEQLSEQLKIWAMEINDVLTKSSNGKMISEWAKSTKCWDIVKVSKFSLPTDSIPEIKK